MLTNILRRFGFSKKPAPKKGLGLKPVIIPRSQHTISRANISKHALKVLYRLKDAGYQAYLVGGGVRDVLLQQHPKDFDVATDAKPEEVQELFRNCRLIGRRFRLAHVHFGNQIVEVATFRASAGIDQPLNPHLVHSEHGMILRDNVYGTLEEDVIRRDFTVNALYYNIADFSLIDFMSSLKDIKEGRLRMIGDAHQRMREDPVRILRAIRFAAKLNFKIDAEMEAAIRDLSFLVKQAPSARLVDEFIKLFLYGFGEQSYHQLREYQLLSILLPEVEESLKTSDSKQIQAFILAALQDTDTRVHEERPVALPFLLAAFLWYPVVQKAEKLQAEGYSEINAFFESADSVLNEQQKHVSISRRYIQGIREIWILQLRLSKRAGKRAGTVFAHPRFRAAFDFLVLRAKTTNDENLKALAEWWKEYVHADSDKRFAMVNSLEGEKRKPRRRSTRRSTTK